MLCSTAYFLQNDIKANVKTSDFGTVSILLGTYNGELYIQRQLDSIRAQTYQNWVLYVSDDGSVDRTLEIIKSFARELPPGKVNILQGPHKGFAQNFLHLLKNKSIQSPYYAFCDQDDIWLEEKLNVALNALKSTHSKANNHYQLYGSRTTLVDENEKYFGESPLFRRGFNIENALVQSYAGGNTMVFSRGVKEIFENINDQLNIISHDWLLYIAVTALNGVIIYDDKSYILYRQHTNNLVGSNKGFSSKLNRFKKIYSGEYKLWNKHNHEFLKMISDSIPAINAKTVSFYYERSTSPLARAINFLKSGVYRQAKYETFVFFLMAILGKLN